MPPHKPEPGQPGRRVAGPAAIGIVGRVFAVVGGVALATAALLAFREHGGPRTARAPGVIATADYYPVVQFKTDQGAVIRFQSSVRSSLWKDGDPVTVAYNPVNPADAVIDGFAGRWFFAGLAAALGAAFFVIGLAFSIVAHLRRAR